MSRPKVRIFAYSYILIIAAGVFFCIAPSSAFDTVDVYRILSLVWGIFYILGGLVATSSLVMSWFRRFRRRQIMLNFFEISGLTLILTSNVVYSVILLYSGIVRYEHNVIAAALIILGLTAMIPTRMISINNSNKLTYSAAISEGGRSE